MSTLHRSDDDLSGEWEFCPDPDDEGTDDEWFVPGTSWTGSTIEVPGAWQESNEYRDYTGTAWYRRTFDAPEAEGRTFLQFGAVDYRTTVWVNGERIGDNRGGYLPFEVEATDAINDEGNELVVRVHDPEDLNHIPHGKQGPPWYARISGIWQSVTVETRPSTFVDRVEATPDIDADRVGVDVHVTTGHGGADDLRAVVAVEDEGEIIGQVTRSVENGTASGTIDVSDPTYWTPETPALYDITVELRDGDDDVVDAYTDYFGMREVGVDDGEITLNGDRLIIRGALDQGYYPETLYRPFDDDLFEEEVHTAKELGFNMLRKHIKPAHPDFLEAADRLGLLVWEEPANPTVHSERSKREVREQIEGMIERDYNRPSVVVWSLYNEEWGIGNPQGLDEETSLWEDEEKQAYLAELYEEIAELDSTRPLCDNSGWAHVATDLNDYHRYFVSPDRASAWKADLDAIEADPATNYASAPRTDPEDAPIVISEFGTWGFTDVDQIRDRYGGDPQWFDYDFFDDPIKRPAGVDERYEATNLPDVFDGYAELATVWQDREFRSIKDVIERMRVRDDLDGYVITEFSDIEWEFNGILDYFREKKSFHDEFADVNAPVSVVVEPRTRTISDDESTTVGLAVVNDTTDPVTVELTWEAFGASGALDVSVDPTSIHHITEAFDVVAPDRPTRGAITVEAAVGDRTVRSTEPIVAGVAADGPEGSIAVPDADLRDRLAAVGLDVDESLRGAEVALVRTVDDDVKAFVEAGGHAVQVPDVDGYLPDGPFETRELPETESWNLVASLFYHDSDLLTDLTPKRTLGWAFEGAYPYSIVSDVTDDDRLHVGYVEGWLANWGSPLVTRRLGDGAVTACTLRIGDAYGEDAVATTLMNRLLTLRLHD